MYFKRLRISGRRGAVVAELALASPVLVFMTLATTSVCNLLFLKQSLTVAAYEAARVAIIPDANLYDVETQAQEVCTARNVTGATVQISPSDFQSAAKGSFLTVTVTAPTRQTAVDIGLITGTTTVSVSMMKEF